MRQAQIADLLRPSIESLGLELWTLEYRTQGRRGTLRVFIDSPDGVTVEDCERVSREVSAILDVEDPFSGAYTLEVSSPGLDRSLHELAHYQRFAGATVKIRLRAPYEGRKNFQGSLAGVEGDEIVLRQDEEEYLFPLELIEKASVVPEFGSKGK